MADRVADDNLFDIVSFDYINGFEDLFLIVPGLEMEVQRGLI